MTALRSLGLLAAAVTAGVGLALVLSTVAELVTR